MRGGREPSLTAVSGSRRWESVGKAVADDTLFALALGGVDELVLALLLPLADFGERAAQELVFDNRGLGHAAVLVKGSRGKGDTLMPNRHDLWPPAYWHKSRRY